ncbi:MAG TPA: hypothetical protein VK886_22555 [Vicinamibacterales bacterium]|nr:hypothetical protein [Vicinamibacterales bacterium]
MTLTRTRRAMLASAFAYLQFATSIVLGLIVVPMVLSHVDVRSYGLWLTAADLLGYAALLDLGIFGVLPWLVAQADGAGDHDRLRRAISNATAAALALGALVALAAIAMWHWVPAWVHMTDADRAALSGPLLVYLAGSVVSLPLHVAGATVTGLQDYAFGGTVSLIRSLVAAVLTIGLLLAGYQLYALAFGVAIPSIGAGAAMLFRLHTRFRHLARGWPVPTVQGVRWLLHESVGAWLGVFGWRLLSTTNAIVLTAAGHPELVPLYSCTARLSTVLTQMGWVLPDSGLVGLAQLQGEGRPARLREVSAALLKLHVIIAGGTATLLVAVNPAFVSWWVGPQLYGGDTLNVLLAAGLLLGAITHALVTVSAVLGRRVEVGVAAIVNGLLQVGLAFLLVQRIGYVGLAVAALASAAVTTLPVAIRLAAATAGVSATASLLALRDWALRAAVPVAIALAVGLLAPAGRLPLALAMWVPVAVAYVWLLRPLIGDLPLDPKLHATFVRLRLLPAAERGIAAEPVA